MNRRQFMYILVLTAVFFSTAFSLRAQHTTDEFKKNLRKSLFTKPELTPNLKHQSIEIEQYQKEKLEVSPETKLPSRFDKIEILNPIAPEKNIRLNLNVTNIDVKSQLERSSFNYSNGKVYAIPDARSKEQFCQHTRNDYQTGVYADKDSPEWLIKLRNKLTPQYRNIDLDPVRAIQRYKAAQRKKKVDNILKAYGQETE